jgi:GxxExxY protein
MIASDAELSEQVIGAAIAVHRALGSGLLESAYSYCLAIEFAALGIPFQREVTIPVFYRGQRIDHGFRADFIVDARLLVELKSAQVLHPVYQTQVITYLKLLGLKRGLLINFHSRRLVDGVRSVVA